MANTVFILNGTNLNRLGTREPDIYGSETLADVKQRCEQRARELNLIIDFRQTNFEGELVESIHDAIDNGHGLIINPAGLTFQSVPVMDALKMFDRPKIELHISNVHAREDFRHTSMLSAVCLGVVVGFGPTSYRLALDALLTYLD